MRNDLKTTRVNLDGVHLLDVTVNEKAKTVVAELITDEETTFIYAEKFDAPCNYLRTAIKKGVLYLGGGVDGFVCRESSKGCGCLNSE